MKTNLTPILRASALAAALGLAPLTAVWAQTAPAAPAPADEPLRLEVFTVTGSNIKRTELEKVLPVTVVDRDAIEVRDAQTPIDLLMALPQVVSVPLNETGTLGASARGDNSSISLRGLSTGNTLILLNGRRLAPHPISAAESSVPALSPNVAQLPNRGLDRIEVLRDGASAIYGSDAVAGVVNYMIRRDYRGAEFTARYGDTTEGGGREWRGTLLFGKDFGGGKGRFVTTFDVYDRGIIFNRDRKFSADADNTSRAPAPWDNYNTATQFFDRSTGSAYGNYTLGTVNAAGTFVGSRPAGVPATTASATGTVFFVPNAAGGVSFQPGTPSRVGVTRDYYYNLSANRVAQPESRRYTWFGSGEYDLSDRLTAFVDLNYYRALSTTYREPDQYAASTDKEIIVPISNPWNPFGSRFFSTTGAPNADGTPRLTGTPSVVKIQNKRFVDLPARVAEIDSEVYRVVAGLRGKLPGTWAWEGAVLYTKAKTTDDEANSTRESFLINAINQTDPARAFNPFGYNFAVQNGALVVTSPYANPASLASSLQQTFTRVGTSSIGSVDFRVTGEVFKLWGGNAISAAIGGEFRHETYTDARPPFGGLNPPNSGLDPTDNDFIALSPNPDTDAERDVTAGYVELVAPVVGRNFTLPLVRSLEFSASSRIEKYSDFGTARKPKVGATWRLVPALMARASYNEGFRAPNLAQLFTGELVRSTSSTDTYRSNVTLLPSDGSANRLERRSGNERLRPEEGRGKSVGVVIDVPWVKGLSVTADYWEINQLGIIDNTTGIADDNDALQVATQAALARGTPINSIDLGSGSANYQGNPNVVRLPVTQQDRDFFAAYNATRAPGNQKAVVGAIQFIRQTYYNKSRQFVNGFDFALTYRFPQTRLGRFAFNTEWTRMNAFFQNPKEGEPRDNRLWEDGAARWRGNAGLTWRHKEWGAGLSAYYVGSFQDTGATTTSTVYNALGRPSYISEVFDTGAVRYRYINSDSITYNTYVTYNHRGSKDGWLSNTSVRFGLVNLFNKEPPLNSDSRGYDTAVYAPMARGRTWSVQLTKKL
ncbi:MAG: TonB-dependent receptor [Opitutaceae bacterium]|nr:TonB-dependent receptor [Opitutaceae bacterium]